MSHPPGDRLAQLGIDLKSLDPLANCMTRRGMVEVRAGSLNGRSLIAYGLGEPWHVTFLQPTCEGPEHLMLHVKSSGGSLLPRSVFWPLRPGGAGLWPRQLKGYVDWVVLAGCPSVDGLAVDCLGLHARLGLTTFGGSGVAIFAPARQTRRLAVTAYGESGRILQQVRVPGTSPRPLGVRRGERGQGKYVRR
jgi:hypothetical protein